MQSVSDREQHLVIGSECGCGRSKRASQALQAVCAL